MTLPVLPRASSSSDNEADARTAPVSAPAELLPTWWNGTLEGILEVTGRLSARVYFFPSFCSVISWAYLTIFTTRPSMTMGV